jgi:hypothetical protein
MATTKQQSIMVNFALEKETKGAVRYAETKDNDLTENVVGTLYIRKSTFAKIGSVPQTLSITITF